MSSVMKSKGSRRRMERELLAMRDEAQQHQPQHQHRSFGQLPPGEKQQQSRRRTISKQESGSVDERRYSEDTASLLSNNEGRGARSTASVVGAGAATDDSCGEEEERAPFSNPPTATRLSASARLVLAERALTEVMAQRDDALELLESSRYENARLSAELDRARSYKALYAAAYH
ncbi:unnamed protein product, partial [Pylaiella littoralis]